MTTFAASVTIVDLPAGTTVTGAELFEAVQTSAGVGQSVQLTLTQMAALPALNSFVRTVGTSLATTGSATSIVAFVANGGITSTQLGSFAVVAGSIATGAVGSTQLGALAVQQSNITAAAIGSTQLGANAVQQSNVTAGAIGSAQIANFAITAGQIQTATIGTAQVVTGAIGVTFITALLPNNVASVAFSSFDPTFRRYEFRLTNFVPATNNTILQMQIATTGTAFVSGGYVSMITVDGGGGGANAIISDTSTTTMILSGTRATTTVGNGTTYGVNGHIRVGSPSNTTFRKNINGMVTFLNGTTSGTANLCVCQLGGYFDGNSNAITAVNFLFSSGNIATGTITIYGYY